jgi:hypothetical protein
MTHKFVCLLFVLLFPVNSALALQSPATADNHEPSAQRGDMNVMQAFAAQQAEEGEAVKISDQEKHQWLFIMGATLLILLLTTASLGIAMGVYGKQVFVAHMITAGLSVTLAIAHAVAALVWFNPF